MSHGALALVLHAHLPYVRGSEPNSLEEDWFFQALIECYLPLLETLEAAAADPRQQPQDRPLFWSVTKALVSTVLAIMEDRGEVDVDKPIDHYIPKLKGSVYEGVRIRDVLDMASGNNCPDAYENWEDCYYRYSSSIGEGFRPPGSPDNPYDYIASLPPDNRFAEPGTGYSYSGVDTFVVGWLVEEISGMPFQDALSREVWTQMGAESDGLIWAGRGKDVTIPDTVPEAFTTEQLKEDQMS